MIARGWSGLDLENAADTVGVQLYNVRTKGKGVAFVLRPLDGSEQWRRRSNTGRRIWAVCWHGHRAFMRVLFALNGEGVIISTHARYDGRRDFEQSHSWTGDKNIGSHFNPMSFRDACDCHAELYFDSRLGSRAHDGQR